MSKTAIVFGATGLTGRELIELLINDSGFDTIKIFARKSTKIINLKVEEHLVDLLDEKTFQKECTGHVAFCCIGTTAKKTPNKDLYTTIDFGIPASLARVCKTNNIPQLICISALGANPNSRVFYNRTKGKMEEALIAEDLEQLHLLRPSLILGKRQEFRMGEKMGELFMTFGQLFMRGSLKKYRPIKALNIAKAMVYLSHNSHASVKIESDEIQLLSNKHQS